MKLQINYKGNYEIRKKITIPNIDASRASDSKRGRSASIYQGGPKKDV